MSTVNASVSRRTLLGIGSTTSSPAATSLMAACGPDNRTTPSERTVSETPTAPSTTASGGSASTDSTLLAFFSRAGKNYYRGDRIDLHVGNTKVLAGMIADRIGCDVFEIQAADRYSDDYDATVQRNVQEENSDARPAIAGQLPDLTGYDTVLLASPIWNVQTPMIMRTFAEALDFTGKTVYPVATYAVSGIGRAADDYRAACAGATIGDSLAILGEAITDGDDSVSRGLNDWLGRVGLR